MILNNEKISARQLYCMIVVSTVGITCLLSTDISVRYAGNKGLLCILFASLLAVLYSILIITICSKTEWNYKKFAEIHLNRFVRSLVYILFCIKYFLMLMLTVAVMLRFLRKEMLKDVGSVMVFLAVILMALYAMHQRIEARGRLAECMIYFILIPTILLAIIGLCSIKMQLLFSDAVVENVQEPLLSGHISKGIYEQMPKSLAGIIDGTIILFFAFAPVEMILFISDKITTYHDSKKIGENSKVKRAVLLAVMTTAVFNIIYYIIITGNLSTGLVNHHHDSLIRFAKSIKLPYLMFENQGGMFIIFFVISIYFAIFSLTYHMTELVKLIFRFNRNSQKKRKRVYAVILAILIFGGVNFVSYQYDYFQDIRMKKVNRVEIEYRKYADCMLIDFDETKDMYQVLLSFRGDGGLNKFTIYETDSLDKIKQISAQSSNRKLDFSHVQVIILNDKIVMDKMLSIENGNHNTRSDESINGNIENSEGINKNAKNSEGINENAENGENINENAKNGENINENAKNSEGINGNIESGEDIEGNTEKGKLSDGKIMDNETGNNRIVYDDIIKYIEDETELSDNLNVCVTNQSVEEFAGNAMELTSQPGIYISKIIENNMRNAGTNFLELSLAQYGLINKCELSIFNANSGKIKYEGSINVCS